MNYSKRKFRGLSANHQVLARTNIKFSWQHWAFLFSSADILEGGWGHPRDIDIKLLEYVWAQSSLLIQGFEWSHYVLNGFLYFSIQSYKVNYYQQISY